MNVMLLLPAAVGHAEPNCGFLFADGLDADKPIKTKKEIKTQ
jgi:hypothetical protein